MLEPDYLKLTKPKPSEYNVYKNLSFQEEIHSKNKFDNRLYFSLRYKHLNYNSRVIDEIFENNRLKALVKLNVNKILITNLRFTSEGERIS